MAGIVLCAGLLSGCAEDPPEPSTLDDKQTTSREPSPTPTPTSTLSAEEQDAVEAATAAYHRWYDIVNRFSKAPQDYTISEMKTELYKVGGDPQAKDTLVLLNSDRTLGRVQEGERKVEQITTESVHLDVVEGDYPRIQLRVCVDTSEVDLVDVETGESVIESAGRDKSVSYVDIWFYEGAWHVVEEDTPSKGEKC